MINLQKDCVQRALKKLNGAAENLRGVYRALAEKCLIEAQTSLEVCASLWTDATKMERNAGTVCLACGADGNEQCACMSGEFDGSMESVFGKALEINSTTGGGLI